MISVPKFLVVDDVAENRFLVVKTLLRKFPQAIIQECEHSVPALAAVRQDRVTAIIVHRAEDVDGVRLIAQLRRLNATVPIIMVSGRETCPEAATAGATLFLNYEAWLRIGVVVEEILAQQARRPSAPTEPVAITT